MLRQPNIGTAIKAINANAEFSAEDIDNITWLNDTVEISKSDIEAKLAELTTAYNNQEDTRANLKASAKAKLISGEALTEDEANTIVL